MKKMVLALLLAYIMASTPWRLLALLGETMVVRPGLTHIAKGSDQYWDVRSLELRLVGLGWQVVYTPHLTNGRQEVYGVTDLLSHTIQVDAALEWNARYMVLAHEGGHALMSIDEWASDADAEAFAEAVSVLVYHDGLREHARYMANHKMALLNAIVMKTGRIYRAAAMLQE